jgi:hypothetical protein
MWFGEIWANKLISGENRFRKKTYFVGNSGIVGWAMPQELEGEEILSNIILSNSLV